MIKFLDLYSQYLSIKKEIDQAISNVINENGFARQFDNFLLSLPIGEHLSINDDVNAVVASISGG